jgi:hypothetical protein
LLLQQPRALEAKCVHSKSTDEEFYDTTDVVRRLMITDPNWREKANALVELAE